MDARALDAKVRELADKQRGYFHLGQLVDMEPARATRERRVATGAWITEYPGIYRLAGAPRSWEGDVLAACWAGGHVSGASHRTAAKLWNLPGSREQPIEIICKRWRRTRTGDLLVHESLALGVHDLDVVDGIPVTSVARTLLDLSAVSTDLVVDMAIDEALRRKLITLAKLEATVRRLGRSGRNGVGVLRNALEQRGTRAPTESAMETWLLDVIRRHELPRPVVQYVVVDSWGEFLGRVDAAYPEAKLAIEYESYAHHVGKAALVRDSARRNRLVAAGWTVLTVTAVDLQTGGHQLCRAIRECLERARP